LIPKRTLTRVLGAPGATVDGLHLSVRGHAELACALAPMLRPSPPALTADAAQRHRP